jgi:hypothetical protein
MPTVWRKVVHMQVAETSLLPRVLPSGVVHRLDRPVRHDGLVIDVLYPFAAPHEDKFFVHAADRFDHRLSRAVADHHACAPAPLHVLARDFEDRHTQFGHPNRHFAQLSRAADDPVLAPARWVASAAPHEGSWWPAWHDWLLGHGSGLTVKARTPSAADVLCDASGE